VLDTVAPAITETLVQDTAAEPVIVVAPEVQAVTPPVAEPTHTVEIQAAAAMSEEVQAPAPQTETTIIHTAESEHVETQQAEDSVFGTAPSPAARSWEEDFGAAATDELAQDWYEPASTAQSAGLERTIHGSAQTSYAPETDEDELVVSFAPNQAGSARRTARKARTVAV
jgi:hypothetical protein